MQPQAALTIQIHINLLTFSHFGSMADPTTFLDLGLQLIQVIPDTGRKIASWNFERQDVSNAIKDFLKDISELEEDIAEYRKWHETMSELTPLDISNLTKRLCRVEDSISRLRTRCNEIGTRAGRKRHRMFVTLLKDQLNELKPTRDEVVAKIDGLEKIQSYFQSEKRHGNNEASSSSAASYQPVFSMAPRNLDYISLDFDGDAEEASLWRKVSNKSNDGPVGAVARGQGGVGKTTAVCGIAYHEKTRIRFPDGVFFVNIGVQGNVADLIKGIAQMVKSSGNSERSDEIRGADSLLSAVSLAAQWFQERYCLFIFDDVWIVNDISESVLDSLRQIAHHRLSRMVYTTRDSKVRTFPKVEFMPKGDVLAKEMLLKVAELVAPKDPQAQIALNKILRLCAGLPVYISIAGKAIRELSQRYKSPEKGFALVAFIETGQDEIGMDGIEPILRRSLDVANAELGQATCLECFASLSILRNGERLPLKIIEKLWGRNATAVRNIIDIFERISILRVHESSGQQRVSSISLHDTVLTAAREFSNSESLNGSYWDQLVSSYCQTQGNEFGTVGSSTEASKMSLFKEWWHKVKDDGYIFEHIIWLLGGARRYTELFWLMTTPGWIINQLNKNGHLQVRADILVATGCISKVSEWTDEFRKAVKQWLRLLENAVTLTASVVGYNSSEEVIWTQLYGRLLYHETCNEWVNTFLRKIEQNAPRP